MPRLILTAGAVAGIARCRSFLAERNEPAAAKAGQEIDRRLGLLDWQPTIGRPAGHELRELTIRFGKSGYVALYRHDAERDLVIVLAFRHQREAGYR